MARSGHLVVYWVYAAGDRDGPNIKFNGLRKFERFVSDILNNINYFHDFSRKMMSMPFTPVMVSSQSDLISPKPSSMRESDSSVQVRMSSSRWETKWRPDKPLLTLACPSFQVFLILIELFIVHTVRWDLNLTVSGMIYRPLKIPKLFMKVFEIERIMWNFLPCALRDRKNSPRVIPPSTSCLCFWVRGQETLAFCLKIGGWPCIFFFFFWKAGNNLRKTPGMWDF